MAGGTKKDKIKYLNPPKTTEEARERGRKGGLASVEAKRRRKSMKEAAIAMMEQVMKNPETGIEENGYEAVVAALVLKAISGDVAAINSLRDLIGEKPTDKTQLDATIEVVMDKQSEKYGK